MNRSAAAARLSLYLAATGGAFVALVALAVLLGWVFGVPVLESIYPHWPLMAPATALGFILCGVSLWCVSTDPGVGDADGTRMRLARTGGMLVALLGASKLTAYAFGWNLAIDTLWFRQPAHVAPATAAAFALAGTALWLIRSRREQIFQALAVTGAFLAWLGFSSYLFGGTSLLPYAHMAFHTSLLFLVLNAGLLCAHPASGLMALLLSRSHGGWMTLWLLLLVPPVAVAIDWLSMMAETSLWFGSANSAPLFATLDVMLLTALIWTAGHRLHGADQARAQEAARRRVHETRLRLLVEHAPAAIAMFDSGMRYLAVSNRWLSDYRLVREEIIGRTHYEIFPEIPERWKDIHRRCLAGAVDRCEEDPFHRPDGTTDWVRWEIHPWEQEDGTIGGIILFSEVITERKLAQERIRRLNRVHAVLSAINSLIVRVHDRQRLLEEACRIAVEKGDFGFAGVSMAEEGSSMLAPAASAGIASCEILIQRHDISDMGAGQPDPVSVAAREQRPVVENDLTAGTGPGSRHSEELLQQGLRSMIALPLLVDGETEGVLTICSNEPDFFDDDELGLLTELAEDVAFALKHLKQEQQIDYLHYYDALTGLPNRRLFSERLDAQLRMYTAHRKGVALALVDIERFRRVNESLGQDGGDELLRAVAGRLKHAVGDVAALARIAADRFAVALPDACTAADVAHDVEEKILPCFHEPYTIGDAELRISARAGLAISPSDGRDSESLLRNAEAALKVSRGSATRYVFYRAEMNAQASRALSLESRLRKAVEAREFMLYYQPKYTLTGRHLRGFEALLRWQCSENEVKSPAEFLPTLEETGLIVEVGRLVLERVLADRRAWISGGLRVPTIAVNVSAAELHQNTFVPTILDTVQACDDDPDALELELTESLVMYDVEHNIRSLTVLRGVGIQVAMDDFGTGYSSLSRLARLPIDKIKIDRSFVAGMTGNHYDLVVVSTVIALAHSFRLPVVAEGVETEEQARALSELGCDEAQGYLFSRPLPPGEVSDLLLPAHNESGLQGPAASAGFRRM